MIDRKKLDLDALREYFTAQAYDDALNAAAVAGVREIAGAGFCEVTDVQVR